MPTELEPVALLFDLFGTLVEFDFRRLDTVATRSGPRYLTIQGLEDLLERVEPRPSVEQFYVAFTDTSRDLAAEIERSHREVPAHRRFERTLAALGFQGSEAGRIAAELARRHMQGLAAAVVCRSGRAELLQKLGARYRLGLISNFDHEPTAREILRRYGLAESLQTILISDGVGIRKPAAEIFIRACDDLELSPRECLYVGDSRSADVEGAFAAGLAVVWIHAGRAEPAPALAALADVDELPAWLKNRYQLRVGC